MVVSRGVERSNPAAGKAGEIVRQGLRVLSAQAAVALLSVGFTAVAARLLSKPEFATFGVYTIVCAATDMVANLGLESTALQLVPSRPGGAAHGESRALMATVLASRLTASAIVAICLAAAAVPLSRCLLKSAAYAPAMRCMAVGAFAFSAFQGIQLLGQAAQEFGKISLWSATSGAVQRGLAIGLFFGLGLEGYLGGLAAGQLLGAAGLGWSLRRHFSCPGRRAPWASLVRRSLPFYARGFGRFGFLQADQALVALAMAPEVFATYSLCRQLANYLRSAMEAFLTPLLVKASELRHASRVRLQRAFTRASRYTLLGAAPLCCAAALGSRSMLALFAGGKYQDGWPMLAALCLAQLLYVAGSVYGVFLFAAGRPAHMLRLDFAAGTISLLLTSAAVMTGGVRGAAFAQLLTFALLIVVARRVTAPVMRCQLDTSAVRALARPLLLGSALVAVLETLFYSGLLLPLYLAAGSVIFVLLLLPRLTAEDWATLTPLWPRLAHCLLRARQSAYGARLPAVSES